VINWFHKICCAVKFNVYRYEEGALVCRVCREGYKLRPLELMGVYCFCKRVDGAAGWGSAR
jgi:E3 ubiquitin-protein ligase UBR4